MLTNIEDYIMMFIDVLFTQSVVIPPLIKFMTPLDCSLVYLPTLACSSMENTVQFLLYLSHTKDNNV